MKSKFKKIFVMLIVFALLLTSVIGCGQKTNQQGTVSKPIRLTVSGTPVIDPAVGKDYSSSIALLNLYDTLVYPQLDGTLKPALAERWEVDKDGLNYTFYLRKGVKFHDGNELTADDVVFSTKRLLTIGQGFAYLFTDKVADVKAIDKYTVQFTLKKRFAPFLDTLVRLYILNKDLVLKHIKSGQYGEMGDYGKEWLVSNDAGSGPYMLKELKQQQYLYAVQFKDYWGGWDKDAPDSIKLIDMTEGATVRTLLASNQIDLTDMWQTPENINEMAKLPGVSVCSIIEPEWYVMLNTKKPPTDDVNFRKALAYIFDYDSIVKLFPGSVKAQGPVPHVLPGHDPNVYQYTQDFNKAKEYLQKSKYAGKLEQYPVEVLVNTDVADIEKIALSMQSAAEKVGIKIKITKVPWVTLCKMVANIDTTPNALIVNDIPNYNEAGSLLESRYHSKTCGTWEQAEWLQNKEIDAMIEDALATMDKNERFEKYSKIQSIIVNDLCPSIFVADLAERVAYHSDRVYWPAAELAKQGKNPPPIMGYAYYFHDFKIKK